MALFTMPQSRERFFRFSCTSKRPFLATWFSCYSIESFLFRFGWGTALQFDLSTRAIRFVWSFPFVTMPEFPFFCYFVGLFLGTYLGRKLWKCNRWFDYFPFYYMTYILFLLSLVQTNWTKFSLKIMSQSHHVPLLKVDRAPRLCISITISTHVNTYHEINDNNRKELQSILSGT